MNKAQDQVPSIVSEHNYTSPPFTLTSLISGVEELENLNLDFPFTAMIVIFPVQ